MNLEVHRTIYTERSTIGKLSINGVFECFTLEDMVRAPGVKVQNKTAIPAGKYRVTIDFSNRFQKYMFHILDVPMFTGIRIHSGNSDVDTDGCLLVGTSYAADCVENSRRAFADLWQKCVKPVMENGQERLGEAGIPEVEMIEECWIEIFDAATALENETAAQAKA